MNERFNMPWEERPAGCTDVMWRYSKNPVIGRYHIPSSNSIFNSAVVPFGDGFAGVFRCDNKAVQMNIFQQGRYPLGYQSRTYPVQGRQYRDDRVGI